MKYFLYSESLPFLLLELYGEVKSELDCAERNAMTSREEPMSVRKPVGEATERNISTVGERTIEGLEEAVAWSKGEDVPVRVSQVQVAEIEVSQDRD